MAFNFVLFFLANGCRYEAYQILLNQEIFLRAVWYKNENICQIYVSKIRISRLLDGLE